MRTVFLVAIMKKNNFHIIFVILLSTFFFAFMSNKKLKEKPIIIHIDKGVDDLEFCISNRSDVIKQYKDIYNFKIGKGTIRSCWSDDVKRKEFEILYNKKAGLGFCFSCNENLLSKIEISNKNCIFDNGIKIGKSTKNDVINAFDIDTSTVNSFVKLYLEIKHLNIETTFKFNEDYILKEVSLEKVDITATKTK